MHSDAAAYQSLSDMLLLMIELSYLNLKETLKEYNYQRHKRYGLNVMLLDWTGWPR